MRWKVWLPLATIASVALAAGLTAWLQSRPARHSAQPREEAFPPPPLSASPYLNTGSDASYVGIAVCKECHRKNYDSYLHTAHSRAMGDVDPAAEPPDGAFEH